ncbi:hypothetical protein [Streptococcus parauberis]|nr:hypothetical protein [Streptococcus parauberis]KYP21681.1 hypothetical protein AKL14_00592 [Streptococcus parauberis]KYP21855.1 hypothetical protein AKL13_00355 [Streptococcus parauberis]KYP21927.1 hypothetical protein TN39_00176 [Streptococcus parauberis]KYP23747.1 hypothetical protein ADO04_01623 [Streptococcus parauberis]KYP25340.1 hypothetical protein TP84_01642 [Streptococcus parauberis]
MKVEIFKCMISDLEELQDEINSYVNELEEEELECFDIKFNFISEQNKIRDTYVVATLLYGKK